MQRLWSNGWWWDASITAVFGGCGGAEAQWSSACCGALAPGVGRALSADMAERQMHALLPAAV